MSDGGWRYSDDRKSVVFEDKEMYVKAQSNTFKNRDDPRNIKRNTEVVDALQEYGKDISKVVDVGCRECFTEQICKARGIECLGVDISPEIVAHSVSKGRNVVVGDAHYLSKDIEGEWDAVISVHSLEHCYNVPKVLNEFRNTVRDSGYIAIRIPIQEDITVQPLLVENAEKSDVGLPAHYAVFKPDSFKGALKDAGFKILFCESLKVGTRYEEFFVVGQKI
jgi:SAM-dependent methyltransferase